MGISEKLERPDNLKGLKIIFGSALLVSVIMDLLIQRHHAIFPWDKIPGFSAAFGLLSCALLILISKYIGKALIMKKEDHYD